MQGVVKKSREESREHRLQRFAAAGTQQHKPLRTERSRNTTEVNVRTHVTISDGQQPNPTRKGPVSDNLKIQIVNTKARKQKSEKKLTSGEKSRKTQPTPFTAETASQLVHDILLKTLPQVVNSLAAQQHVTIPGIPASVLHHVPPIELLPPPQVPQLLGRLVHVPPATNTPAPLGRSLNEIFGNISKVNSNYTNWI